VDAFGTITYIGDDRLVTAQHVIAGVSPGNIRVIFEGSSTTHIATVCEVHERDVP
jgi:hypothetical protein